MENILTRCKHDISNTILIQYVGGIKLINEALLKVEYLTLATFCPIHVIQKHVTMLMTQFQIKGGRSVHRMDIVSGKRYKSFL